VNALLLNRGDVTLDITLFFADVWVESGAELVLRDLWAEKDIGRFSGSYTAKAVPSHGNVALSMRKATGTSAASASV
jgi:alpha-galactosidase